MHRPAHVGRIFSIISNTGPRWRLSGTVRATLSSRVCLFKALIKCAGRREVSSSVPWSSLIRVGFPIVSFCRPLRDAWKPLVSLARLDWIPSISIGAEMKGAEGLIGAAHLASKELEKKKADFFFFSCSVILFFRQASRLSRVLMPAHARHGLTSRHARVVRLQFAFPGALQSKATVDPKSMDRAPPLPQTPGLPSKVKIKRKSPHTYVLECSEETGKHVTARTKERVLRAMLCYLVLGYIHHTSRCPPVCLRSTAYSSAVSPRVRG